MTSKGRDSGRTEREGQFIDPYKAHYLYIKTSKLYFKILTNGFEFANYAHELEILVRRDGRSGRTQKESRRTENGTAPANAHGGALGIDIMKRCGRAPVTTT